MTFTQRANPYNIPAKTVRSKNQLFLRAVPPHICTAVLAGELSSDPILASNPHSPGPPGAQNWLKVFDPAFDVLVLQICLKYHNLIDEKGFGLTLKLLFCISISAMES